MASTYFKLSRNTLLLLAIAITVLMLAVYVQHKKSRHVVNKELAINGVFLSTPLAIPDFHLTDHLGRVFTQDNLKGQWSLVFFGFTHCGMVCPTTLSALNGMYKTLQSELPKDKWPQIIFITIDNERDTVQRLHDYVQAYNANFIGARAESVAAQDVLMRQFGVIAAKMQASRSGADNYSFDHSADILVFNPQAHLQASLSYPHQAASLARDYELIIQ